LEKSKETVDHSIEFCMILGTFLLICSLLDFIVALLTGGTGPIGWIFATIGIVGLLLILIAGIQSWQEKRKDESVEAFKATFSVAPLPHTSETQSAIEEVLRDIKRRSRGLESRGLVSVSHSKQAHYRAERRAKSFDYET
jgi:type VI protein secretion system component VasK